MGLLEKKAAEKKAIGRELICNLCMDEMSIRQHVQWCDSNKSMIGYSTFGEDADFRDPKVAKQAIVFMLVGVNERFKLPIAYHFINSLNGKERAELLRQVLNSILRTGIIILATTFDGLPANESMCEYLGANFQLDTEQFRPNIVFEDGQKIYIIKDPPHME